MGDAGWRAEGYRKLAHGVGILEEQADPPGTKRSFRLSGKPPTVTVVACYSKRRRVDTLVLHPEVVRRLKRWLKTKRGVAADALLFPVSAKIPGGTERRTADMMRADLLAAKRK